MPYAISDLVIDNTLTRENAATFVEFAGRSVHAVIETEADQIFLSSASFT